MERSLLAKLRHDLRTPLNAIIGYGEMLLEEAEDLNEERLIPDLQKILSGGNQLLALVNDILDPVKIENSPMSRNPDAFGVALRQKMQTPLTAVMETSGTLVEKIDQTSRRDAFIPDLRKIFSAAKQFALLVNSIPNSLQNDEAETKIPHEEIPQEPLLFEDTEKAIRPRKHDIVTEAAEGGSLLIVEDDENNRDLLTRYLQHRGHRVAVAENGRKAMELLLRAHNTFDLVLLDIMMPEMNGYQVLSYMKKNLIWREIPVIMISAMDEMDSVVRCIQMGAEDLLPKPINPVLLKARVDACLEKKRLRDKEISYLQQIKNEKKRTDDLLNVVIPLGVALSAEQDFGRLLEKIVLEAKSFCNADAGTIYLRTNEDQLRFVVVVNDTLKMAMGGTSGREPSFPPLRLYDEITGEPNHHYIATHVALSGVSLNIPDAYQVGEFDFYGTRTFDAKTGYRCTSFLTIPLKNNQNQVIGVLELINAKDFETGQVVPFDSGRQQMIESLSLLAAAALGSYERTQGLRQEIHKLRIELNETKQARQVSEITETDFFRGLKSKAKDLRNMMAKDDE